MTRMPLIGWISVEERYKASDLVSADVFRWLGTQDKHYEEAWR